MEESTIAHLTHPDDRGHIFAYYSLVGTGGVALGFIVSGWVTTLLIEHKQFSTVEAYRVIYFGYAAVGLIKFLLTIILSSQCEADVQPERASETETAPLLQNENSENRDAKKPSKFALLPHLSTESKVVLVQLCLLFAFDNFASGLAPM